MTEEQIDVERETDEENTRQIAELDRKIAELKREEELDRGEAAFSGE
jgi:hypothetical protein